MVRLKETTYVADTENNCYCPPCLHGSHAEVQALPKQSGVNDSWHKVAFFEDQRRVCHGEEILSSWRFPKRSAFWTLSVV